MFGGGCCWSVSCSEGVSLCTERVRCGLLLVWVKGLLRGEVLSMIQIIIVIKW